MRAAVALAIMTVIGLSSLASSGHSGIVPWIPDQPLKFRARPLARPCRVSDLRIGLFLQGGTGGLVGGIKVKHRGTQRCSLKGTPSIRFIGGTRQRLTRGRLRAEGDLPRAALRSLGRGDEAYAAVAWSNWCARKPRAIEVGLPHGGGHVILGFVKVTSCLSRHAPARLSVSSFAPLKPQPAALPLTFSFAEKRLPVARAGHPFRFLVRLTNVSRHLFRFGRCPVYEQNVSSFHISKWEKRILNCRPVERLRPGESATFEMVIDIPANAREEWTSLDWSLPSTVGDVIERNITVRR